MDNAPVVIERQNPASMIEVALTQGADLEKLEKLLELQERWERNEAKKAYVRAMAEFKKDPPFINKDKTNKQFGSKYSSIDTTVNTTVPYLSKHGLSHNWQFSVGENGWPIVTCVLTHEYGHSESVTMTAPPDTSGGGSKNPIQQIKSTQTYLKIATFEAVTGLVSSEANQDDDGNGAYGSQYITDEQLSQIRDYIDNYKVDEKAFLKYMGVDSLKEITAKDFNKAISALKSKAKK